MIADCPSCEKGHMECIDILADWYKAGEDVEVWMCDECEYQEERYVEG